ncbi:MAG: hypothetical protein AAF711_07715 [Planctomycetota bacterium]
MADPPTIQPFPAVDSLCEVCGYPLRGLPADGVCPECGSVVIESSPAIRTLDFTGHGLGLKTYWRTLLNFLIHPKRSFRLLAISRSSLVPEKFLFRNSFISGLLISAIVFVGTSFIIQPRFHTIPFRSAMILFLACAVGISLLTFIEMLGVTAFSRRRGWRVPLPVAQRVCCLASVGWLPGAVIAGVGIWLLQAYGVGRPWFDQLLGLVRVGWLLYGVLFVLSALWFETLVWIGVRQVKYANTWPDAASGEPSES